MRASSLRRAFPLLAAAALALVAGAGCLPNASWLPDSTGFVYTGGPNHDQLILYDVKEGKGRVLVKKDAGPAWPAVSPDGKRFAVALRKRDGDAAKLEVAVFDRDGKELQRSKPMDWRPTGGGDELAAQCFWAPDGDRLLLSSEGLSAFYDVKTGGSVKMALGVATFGNTPIRPDGKGFLAYREGGQYVFVDWDGKEKEVEAKSKDLFGGDEDPASPRGGLLAFPLMHSSRWDGSKATASWGDVRIVVDTDKLTATRETIKPALTADKKVIQHQVELAGGAVIRAAELVPRYTKEPRGGGEPGFGRYRLEVLKPGEKEPKTVADPVDYFMIYPSPDGKTAVVRGAKTGEGMFENHPGDDLLYLIDAKGDVAAKIDTAKAP
jgi:dipeptidyl aminopeptidase/acylaminoacyl peptidase